MVLVGLVVAGVTLTIDKIEKRQAAKARKESEGQEPINITAEASRKRREQEAFNELQTYADFQDYLSTKVLDDLGTDSPPDYEASFPAQGWKEKYSSPSTSANRGFPAQTTKSRLPVPIVIPQERSNSGSSCWSRAYTPILMSCGINQLAFLEFVDSFNEHVQRSPYINAVNIAWLRAETDWQDSLLILSETIPIAVRQAKFAEHDMENNTFLEGVNTTLFRPHGLFAMIVTSDPSQKDAILTVAFNPLPTAPTTQPHAPGNTTSPPTTPRASPPITKKSSKLRKMGNLIAEYSDHRPSFFSSNLSSHINMYTNPTVTPKPSSQYFLPSRGQRKVDSRRLRRKIRTPAHMGSLSHPSTSGSGSYHSPSSFNRDVARPETETEIGKEETRSSPSAGGIQPGVLYLVIVNDPDFDVGVEGEAMEVDSDGSWNQDVKGKGRSQETEAETRTETETETRMDVSD